MYPYQVLVTSHWLHETTLKDEPIDRVYLPIRLVNSLCLLATSVKVEATVRESLPSHLALLVRDNC